jgi:hypothetical protein
VLKFSYTAIDADGATIVGSMRGDSAEAVRAHLLEDDLVPLRVVEALGGGVLAWTTPSPKWDRELTLPSLRTSKPKASTFTSAGISVFETLATINNEASDAAMRKVLAELIDDRVANLSRSITDQVHDMKVEMVSLSAVFLQRIDDATSALTASEEAKMREFESRVEQELGAVSQLNAGFEPIRERIGRIGLELASIADDHHRLRDSLEKRISTVQHTAEVLEAKISESSSVDIAVYLDRVAEIERAISDLDPDRFALAEELKVLSARLTTLPPPSANQ